MNTITIELCKEDRQRLDEVIAFLGLIAGELKSRPTEGEMQEVIQEATGSEHPADAPTTHLEPPAEDLPWTTEAPASEVKPVSFAEFQKAVTQAVAKGPKQKAAAKQIVNEYAPSVSEVPEDKRAEVMARLAEI